MLLVTGAGLALTPPGQAAWRALIERNPHDLVRYTLRRLQGHSKLEMVFVPPLLLIQAQIEREPPNQTLPSFAKGRQAKSLPAVRGLTRTLGVDTPQAIREALLQATPGTEILIAPGLYPFRNKLRLGHAGMATAPIALRAEHPGTVWLLFEQVEGILVDRPHWVFENLDIRGVCQRHDDCEHAFHVVGDARHTQIRNNHIRDFNAHIKVNGHDGHWPDHGLVAFNTLLNTSPRDTYNPVAPLDLVGANHWRVLDNHVSNFIKADGNQIAYGLFMKGGGEGGRFERNVVICTPKGISQPGLRVGISFGGGGTDPPSCRHERCKPHEHRQGLAANNLIAHCNDVGLDVNHSKEIALLHNTLINTAGIAVRRKPSFALIRANLLQGHVGARDGAQAQTHDNLWLSSSAPLANADALDLRWLKKPTSLPVLADAPSDLQSELRTPAANAPGALR